MAEQGDTLFTRTYFVLVSSSSTKRKHITEPRDYNWEQGLIAITPKCKNIAKCSIQTATHRQKTIESEIMNPYL